MAVLQVTMVVVLLASVFVGLLRVFIGPTTGDRMLAAQLLGTGGVAVLLLLAFVLESPSLIDVALVFALLAAVTAVAFARDPRSRERGNSTSRGSEGDAE